MLLIRRLRIQNIQTINIILIIILLYAIKQLNDKRSKCDERFQRVLREIAREQDEIRSLNQTKWYPGYRMEVPSDGFSQSIINVAKKREKMTIDEIQILRHIKLRNMCKRIGRRKLNLDDEADFRNAVYHNVSMDTVYWSDEFKFTVSIIHKVGSKNWRILFSHLRSRTKPIISGEYLSMVKDKEEVKKRLTEYYNILFVRHPLTRVVSGYRDKFEGRTVPEYVDLGRVIIKRYRKVYSTKELSRATGITFNEFVMFLLDMNLNRTETIDRHWIPIVYRGRPCELEYDFIGRLETIDRDIPYLYAHLGFNRIISYNKGQSRKSSDSVLLKSYYNQLPKDIFHGLLNLYKEDFLLFGYKIPNDRSDFDELLLAV